MIERVTLAPPTPQDSEILPVTPGLRINIRSTTGSLSDYDIWNLDELTLNKKPVVTDGTCS